MKEFFSRKSFWIIGGVIIILTLAALFWYFRLGTKVGGVITKILPFGAPVENTAPGETGSDATAANGGSSGNTSGAVAEKTIFRQLTNVPIAGAYPLLRGGVEYVHYVEKETGHTHEINLDSGEKRQLTNTTIPRVAMANWALDGNAVVLRYLEKDELSGRDIVKTNLGYLPTQASSNLSTGTPLSLETNGGLGSLTINLLPDNIIAVSVDPDGSNLFYLVKTTDGVSGSIINLKTKITKEVFHSTFSEWLPQLLSNGEIILTTKPSGGVLGYSYHFDPKTQTLERLVRNKSGLTTLGNRSGSRILYGENVSGNPTLGVYSKAGFAGDEGVVNYESTLPIMTFPEKCLWLIDDIRALCGSFTPTNSALLPDLWYQGRVSLSDTFWSIDTDTSEVTFLADPKKEIKQEFDVADPMISPSEDYFIFTNKKDDSLWSFTIPQKVTPTILANLVPANETSDINGSPNGNIPH